MRCRINRALVAFAVGIIVAVAWAAVAGAAASQATPTVVTIQPLQPIAVGDKVTVVVQLATTSGDSSGPLRDQAIELFVDGERERRARTDVNGMVALRISRQLAVGRHTISALFGGSRDFAPAEASTELVVAPAKLEVQVVPPLAGVRLALDGRPFQSDENGLAWIAVEQPGTYRLEMLPWEPASGIRAEFSRWGDEVFEPFREVEIPAVKTLQVGFDTSHQARQSFLDLTNQPVDPGRITSFTLKSSTGATLTYENGDPRWLPAGRVVRRQKGLEESKILYSVASAIVDGGNVVNEAQQRFYVKPNDHWQIQLLLYSARITARDALFRFPIGSGVRIEYPDGRTVSLPFGPDDALRISSQVRGTYKLTVTDPHGLSPKTPVALSKDQEVELVVLSYLDIAVAGVLLATLALGLLFLGRPRLLAMVPVGRRRHRRQGRGPLLTAARSGTSGIVASAITAPTITGAAGHGLGRWRPRLRRTMQGLAACRPLRVEGMRKWRSSPAHALARWMGDEGNRGQLPGVAADHLRAYQGRPFVDWPVDLEWVQAPARGRDGHQPAARRAEQPELVGPGGVAVEPGGTAGTAEVLAPALRVTPGDIPVVRSRRRLAALGDDEEDVRPLRQGLGVEEVDGAGDPLSQVVARAVALEMTKFQAFKEQLSQQLATAAGTPDGLRVTEPYIGNPSHAAKPAPMCKGDTVCRDLAVIAPNGRQGDIETPRSSHDGAQHPLPVPPQVRVSTQKKVC